MKRLNWLLVIPVIFGLVLLTGCEDPLATDDEITITIGSGAVTEANVGDIISFDVSIVAEAKIDELEVRKGTSTIETVTDFQNNDSHVYSFEYEVVADDAATTLEFAFIVADKKENTEIENYSVDIADAAGDIVNQTAKILADLKNSSGGSFYSISDAAVMTFTEAKASSDKVDLVYYYGTQNKAVICAPNDTDAEAFLDANDNAILPQLSTRNATLLAETTVSTTDFNAATDDSIITDNVPSSTSTAVLDLAVDDVFYFETAAGKKGLALVKEINGTTQGNSEITLDIIVQI